jgi:hypothetical protein
MEILCKLTIGLIIRGATMDDMFIMHTQLISLNESAKTIQPYLIAVAAFAVGYMARSLKRWFYRFLYRELYRRHG